MLTFTRSALAFLAVVAPASAMALSSYPLIDMLVSEGTLPAGTPASAPWASYFYPNPGSPGIGYTITFTLSSAACGSFAGTAPGTTSIQSVTDIGGRAATPLFTAGTQAMSCNVTASVQYGSTLSATTSFTVTGGIPPVVVHPLVQLASGDNQVAAVGTQLPQPLQVRVTDRNGQPMANASVEFLVDPDGPTGVFSGTSLAGASVTTDSAGIAQTAFKPTAGVGAGTIYARTFDTVTQAYVSVPMHFTSTFANGATTVDFTDIWWNPVESGWGFAIVQSGAKLFDVLYTYDSTGEPTWITVTNGQWSSGFGSTNFGSLYSPTSSPYYAYDASKFNAGNSFSNLSINFSDVGAAQLDTPLLGASKPLQRFVFGNAAGTKRGVAGMWWGGAAQNGWGLSIFEQGGALFVAWFTYDAAGKPLWFSMSDGRWSDANTWVGSVYRSTKATGSVRTTSVGTFSLVFTGNDNATFSYNVEGHQVSVPIQRFVF